MNKMINRTIKIFALAFACVLSLNVYSATPSKQAASKTAAQLTQSYVWYDGNVEQTVWLNSQVVAEFNPGKAGVNTVKSVDPNAQMLPLKRSQGGVRLWRMDNTGNVAVRSLAESNPAGQYSPVFHVGPTSGSSMRALPGNIIVYLNPTWNAAQVNDWIDAHKLEVVKKLEIGPNIFVINTAPGLEALTTANALYLSGDVLAAFPDWWQELSTR